MNTRTETGTTLACPPRGLIRAARTRLHAAADALQAPFLLLVRLYWGWQFAVTGWGKLQHLARVTAYFASLGIPLPAFNARMVGSLECFGGVLLALGLASRPVAALLTVNMLVAYWTADREALAAVLSDPGKFYGAAPYTFLFAALLVLAFGPGAVALDRLLQWWKSRTPVKHMTMP